MAGPPWAFLLLADIRTTSPPHLPKLLPSPSPIFPPLPRLNKLVPSPPSSLFLRHEAAIPVACGHFRAAPPTLTRATAADIRGLSPLLYHQRCRQGVPSAICTNTVTTKPPHGGEEFTSTSFSWCGGLLCNLWWIWWHQHCYHQKSKPLSIVTQGRLSRCSLKSRRGKAVVVILLKTF